MTGATYTFTEDDAETLGLLVDRLDNFAAGAVLPIPDSVHKEALSEAVAEARDELRGWLVARGFNPWSGS